MRTRPLFSAGNSDVCWVRTYNIRNEQDRELAIEKLEARPSEMRHFAFTGSHLGEEWAVKFAQRALPNMPKLEYLR